MTTSSREPLATAPGVRSLLARASFIALALLVAGYPTAYLHARVTHRLVRYGYATIRPGGAFDPIHGYRTPEPTFDELVFAPLIWLESTVRNH